MSAGGEETALVAAQPLPAGCRSRPFSAPSCSQPLRRMLLDAGGSRPVTRPVPVACGAGVELLLPASANPLCARLARDCHEQNATVSRLSCGRLSLTTTRALCAGEELRPWLSPALLAELGVPVALTPAHIRGHRCYACPDCGAVFEQPNPLKAHLALDACGGKPPRLAPPRHACAFCGKLYSRRYGLKIHVRTHTGHKPLECRFCHRPFSDPSNLNKHVRLHAQRDSPYRCALCAKRLVRRRDLDRHLRARHQLEAPPVMTATRAPRAHVATATAAAASALSSTHATQTVLRVMHK